MSAAKVDLDKREITIAVPAVVAPRDMRAALHRILDEALDCFLPNGGAAQPVPHGPGRVADKEGPT